MRMLVGAALGLSVVSCATLPTGDTWIAVHHRDPFTDQDSCRLAPAGFGSFAITVGLHYYPFVEHRGDAVRVGVLSGGQFKIPVGRVQLRIDDDPAWVIDTSETPVDMVNAPGLAAAAGSDAQDPIARAQRAAMATVYQVSSPYTVATGGKAERILAQMKTGHDLIYQTVGANQAGSTLGHTQLGPEFLKALSECGL